MTDEPSPNDLQPRGDTPSISAGPNLSGFSRPASILRLAICWLLILGTVVITQFPRHKSTATSEPDPAQDLSMQIVGRYIVAMKNLTAATPALSKQMEQLKQSLEKNKTPQQQLLAVPIIAELSGKTAAASELRRLVSQSSSRDVQKDSLLFMKLYRDGAASLSPEQRSSIERYGWLGKLALSQGESPSTPERKFIIQTAFRTMVVLVVVTIAVFLGLLSGVGVLIFAIVLRSKGRLQSRLRMPVSPGSSLLEAFSIYIAGFGALPVVIAWIFPHFRIGAYLLAIGAVIVAIFWPRLRGSNWKDYRDAIGLYRGRGFVREIGSGILGYIAGLPLLAVAVVVVLILTKYTGSVPSHPLPYEIGRGPLHMLVWTLLGCVWAPITEEAFFRGMLFGYFRRSTHWVVSGIITGLIFAVVHPQGWVGVPVIASIGFVLSAIREWRGTLIASMSAHALHNGSLIILIILVLT